MDRTWESPAPAKAPPTANPSAQPASNLPNTASAPDPIANQDILLRVNGEPIPRRQITDLLYACHGLNMIENVILLRAARQRLTAMGLNITDADIDAAHQQSLRQIATPIGGNETEAMDLKAAERLLDEFLQAKNISPREWRMRMEQRACIARIARALVADAEITDQLLREEYDRTATEKVVVRHIQVASLAAATRARAMLAEKNDFELVARKLSENQFTAGRGGLMPPFTRYDPVVPPLIREAAFALQPGEVSGTIHESTLYHILRLEQRIPAEYASYESADQAKLRSSLLDRLRREREQALEAELFDDAAVEISDPALMDAFRKRHRQPT